MIKLSVITINYNNSKGLLNTINSVINQSYKEFEYIIIDGASSDNSLDVILQNEDYITHWISETDCGAYNAMNKGVSLAAGEYCIFMNSGDMFNDRSVLENVIPLLDGVDVITGSTKLSFGRLVMAPNEVPMRYLFNGTLCHQSSFIKRSLLLTYPYDEKLRYVSDWKFWIQSLVLNSSSYKAISEVIAVYDWNGMSTINYEACDRERANVLHDIFPKAVIDDYYKFVVGETWEDKLYIEMRESAYHRFFYRYNVLILKFLSLFRKGAKWINKYPLKSTR